MINDDKQRKAKEIWQLSSNNNEQRNLLNMARAFRQKRALIKTHKNHNEVNHGALQAQRERN